MSLNLRCISSITKLTAALPFVDNPGDESPLRGRRIAESLGLVQTSGSLSARPTTPVQVPLPPPFHRPSPLSPPFMPGDRKLSGLPRRARLAIGTPRGVGYRNTGPRAGQRARGWCGSPVRRARARVVCCESCNAPAGGATQGDACYKKQTGEELE